MLRFCALISISLFQLTSISAVVNVRDFGAKGDAKTDDTKAIQAALAKSSHIYFPAGVYVISNGIDLPRGARLTGDGAPFLGVFPLNDDKEFFSPGKRNRLPGTTVLFRGSAKRSLQTNRSDRFQSMSYALKTDAASTFAIEKMAIALDMIVKDKNDKWTSPENDRRSTCDVGLLIDDSSAGTMRDVNIFGHWSRAGLCVLSRGLGDNPDYNSFWNCSFMGDTGVALLGSDLTNGPGLSGTQFHGCRVFANDHHLRSAGQFGTAAVFIDGKTKAKRADLNGHSFFGGCIRTYNNTAVLLNHASNLSFHGVIFELPAYQGPNNDDADSNGKIVGTANTRDVYLFGCRMHDIGLNPLANQMPDGSMIAIPDRFQAMSINRSGQTVRLSASPSGPYVQLTDDAETSNSGRKLTIKKP